MKHFLIYTNQIKDPGLRFTQQIEEYLLEKGQRFSLCIKDSDWKETKQDAFVYKEPVDVMLVLGGDGTVLEAFRETKEYGIPFIGVNLGTLGYLTEVEKEDIFEALDCLMGDSFKRDSRMLLDGVLIKCDGSIIRGEALNDVVISRTGPIQVMDIEIFVNGQFLHEYHADGVLVTTPTGSTGYNLSAGGPIVEPSANLLMLTPICPHTLNQRSIVLSPEDEIEIRLAKQSEGKSARLSAAIDGISLGELQPGDKVTIRKAKRRAEFVSLNKLSFLELLHGKLKD